MKLVRQSRLHFQEGNSDKVYEVDLCEAGEGEYLVNFRYGRRGARLREGTKTPFPESLAKAEAIFTKLVNSKVSRGYLLIDEEGSAPPPPEQPVAKPETQGPTTDPRHLAILARLKREQAYQKSDSPWTRSRLYWRTGELRIQDAAPLLLSFCEQATSPMEALSLAWAIGRLGDTDAVPALEKLGGAHPERPEVKRMVAEAMAAVVDDDARAALAESIATAFPEHLREAIKAGNAKAIEGAILTVLNPENASDGELASQLYLAARSHPALREGLFHALNSLPTGKGYFHFLRRVFKAAEFRLDAEFYGMMARRWDADRGCGSARWAWNGKRYERQPAPAFSSATRAYLRRRVIRTLERAGNANDAESFITLATGILLAFDDDKDAGEIQRDPTYEWDPQTRNYRRNTIVYPHFSSRHSLMWILHRESPRLIHTKALRWRFRLGVPDDQEATTREEAFPHLWDQAPDALMHLLRFAKAAPVHEFAVRVWRTNSHFNSEADIPFLRDLLKSSYPVTRTLGLDIVRERWDSNNPDGSLLLALLECPDEEAREQGVAWLRECANVLFPEIAFLSSLALNPFSDVQSASQQLLPGVTIGEEQRQALVTRTLAGMLSLDPEEDDHPARAGHATSFLLLAAPRELARIDLGPVSDLAAHPLEGVQLLGVHILLHHEKPAHEIPDDLLLAPLSSTFPAVRKLGMELLGKLDDNALVQRGEILANCAISEHAELRQAVAPLLERLGNANPAFSRELTERLYPVILRKESYEGLHEDVLATLTGPLAPHLDVIPADYFPRMLDSNYKAAQGLGFVLLLKHCDLHTVSLAQTVRWANHELFILREHLRDHFSANPNLLTDQLGTAINLCESDWEDTRSWAFTFFTETVPEEAWNPESLIAICDSVQGEVQDFGRALLTKRFREEDGPLYLLRLSEHPAHEMQVFATNYLERFASGDPDRVQKLEPYFRALFGRLNAGRIAKNRIFAFLKQEALADEATATLAIELLSHYAATISKQDRSACLECLLALKEKWPNLENPLQVHTPPLHNPDAA